MSFVKEFKEFAMRGNVIDMAVGVVIGGAFGKIVSSLVGDVIMPVVGVLTGGVNFTDLKFTLKEAISRDFLEVGQNSTDNGVHLCQFGFVLAVYCCNRVILHFQLFIGTGVFST